jgi:hypothetical protein
VTQSADALTKTVVSDINGDGLTDVTSSEVTTIVAGVRTENLTVTNRDGSIRQKEKTILQADQVAQERWVDRNQDGVFQATDKVMEVTVNATTQARTESMWERSADGTLLAYDQSVTSADGKTITAVMDADGDGDHDTSLSDVTVVNGNGSSTRRDIFATTAKKSFAQWRYHTLKHNKNNNTYKRKKVLDTARSLGHIPEYSRTGSGGESQFGAG